MTHANEPPARRKTVRSFVRREGRVTRGQQRALDELWPRYGLEFSREPYDFDSVFGRAASRVLEIGFGNGEALTQMAAVDPERDYLGVEVHRPGVGHALLCIERLGLTNVRLICHDAVELLRDAVAPGSFARVHIFFPDPWPKKRHHKRRMVQAPFLDLIARALAPGGVLHMATDWENYAEHMLETANAHPAFDNQADGDDLASGAVPRPASRPLTKFEQRGHRHGHGVWDFLYTRADA